MMVKKEDTLCWVETRLSKGTEVTNKEKTLGVRGESRLIIMCNNTTTNNNKK